MNEITWPLFIVVSVLITLLTIASMLIWLERRLLALWQDRYGPNRVGPFGLLQVIADVLKIFTKEDWIPPFADKKVFVVAPMIIMSTVLMSFAVVPFAPGFVVARSQYRPAVLPCDVVHGCLQRRTCGLGLE
jgi:NADH-quinone oxidoreductase subunit H